MKEIYAKYIFLDIVGYSRRYLEAQAAAIDKLNRAVLSALGEFAVPENQRILLPTGDGLCIVLINLNTPIDIHIQIAVKILEHVAIGSQSCEPTEQIELRIGINENTDLEVEDINSERNVVGSGINYAQRLMNLADANQIFLGVMVYEQLKQRASFAEKIRPYSNVIIKHNEKINAYQYIDGSCIFLNSEIPSKFVPKETATTETEIPPWLNVYFRLCREHVDFIKKKSGLSEMLAVCYLLYFLANDEVRLTQTPDHVDFYPEAPGGDTFEEKFETILKITPSYDDPYSGPLRSFLRQKLGPYRKYFKQHHDSDDFRVIDESTTKDLGVSV